MRLYVKKLENSDVYQGRIRIHRAYRNEMSVGQIAKLSCNRKTVFVEIRAKTQDEGRHIHMDQRTRSRLSVSADEEYEFSIIKASFYGQIKWALNADQAAIAIPMKIAIVSFWLGLLSLFLGLLSLMPLFKA